MISQFKMTSQRVGLSKNANRLDPHIIGISLTIGLLLPHSAEWLYYFTPAMVLFLAFRYSDIRELAGVKLVIVVGIMLSSVGYFLFESQVSQKEVFRAIVLSQMILLFPFAKGTKIPDGYLYFAMGYIVLSQMVYVFSVTPLVEFFSGIYPYTGDYRIYETDYLLEKAPDISIVHGAVRLGGMYINPNEFAKQLEFIIAVFFIESRKSYWFKVGISALVMLPLLYTGSRTGLVVFIILFIVFSIAEYRRYSSIKRILMGLIAVLGLGIGFLLVKELFSSSSVRAMDIRGGFENSLLTKLNYFDSYIDTHIGAWQVLFGSFDVSLVEKYTGNKIMDSEWGNAFFAYGIVFILGVIAFFVKVYRSTQRQAQMFFILLIWMISATLFFSYRSSFILLLLLSKYYMRTKEEKHSNRA